MGFAFCGPTRTKPARKNKNQSLSPSFVKLKRCVLYKQVDEFFITNWWAGIVTITKTERVSDRVIKKRDNESDLAWVREGEHRRSCESSIGSEVPSRRRLSDLTEYTISKLNSLYFLLIRHCCDHVTSYVIDSESVEGLWFPPRWLDQWTPGEQSLVSFSLRWSKAPTWKRKQLNQSTKQARLNIKEFDLNSTSGIRAQGWVLSLE